MYMMTSFLFFFFFKGDLVLRRGGWDETLSARQVQKPSRGGPVVDRRDPPHQPGDQSQLFHARLTLAGGLKVASPSSSPPQANVAPPRTLPHYVVSRQRVQGSAVLPEIEMFKLRPSGTRVQPSPTLHLMAGTDPRWCTGCPVPGTSPPGRFLPPSRTARTNWPATPKANVNY